MRRKVRSLKKLLKDKPKTAELAVKCSTKPIYLWQIAQGHRRASVALALKLDAQSGGTIPKHDLRPDVWAA